GQKYIVKNKKTIHIRDKERTLVNDVGLIQINKVNDDNSEAFVILGDMNENNDLGSMWAEEKHYSNIAWELGALGSMNLRSLQNGQFFGGKIGVYSGNLFQFGLAADIFTMGSYFGVTPSLELRYNIHLFKGLFLLAGINGGLELMSATTNLRVPSATPGPYTGTRDGSGNIEVPSQKITVPSLQLSVTALAGFKLFFGPNVYSVLTVGYIYSQDANWNYIVDKNTPAELRQSIANYNPYIANAARNGAKLDISLGYLF
ncbi:MAG: hypothetical protein OEV66_09510, partial [Spirochaetia bacterium]|nr:hypothetical protein [Spirochaetia bacterium]